MGEPDADQAGRYALLRLERELQPTLIYHSVAHTRDEVVPAAERLADLEGVRGEGLLLLRTAAYFHDIGFLERREGHELASVAIAAAALPAFGYSPEQIAQVGELIMATRLPQSPRSHLAAILADSDLDMLGRPDFLHFNGLLRAELAAFGQPFSDLSWYGQQAAFVRDHRYWTPAARRLRDAGKAANRAALEQLWAAAAAPSM